MVKDVYIPSETFIRNLKRALAVSVAPVSMEPTKEKESAPQGLETIEDFIARGGEVKKFPLGASSFDDVYDEKFNRAGKL